MMVVAEIMTVGVMTMVQMALKMMAKVVTMIMGVVGVMVV